MLLKFILIGSICWNFTDSGTQCTQFLQDNLINAQRCETLANSVGKATKSKILKLEGSMERYEATCIAINESGIDIDQTFEISYNIL